MKRMFNFNSSSTRLFLAAILCISIMSSFTSLPRERGNWEKLGERLVNRSLDHDNIQVGAKDGLFTKLKIRVRDSGINLHKMVIHFGDGSRQEIETRNTIRRGGESRVIDLRGNKRIITNVDFWYDTKGGIFNDKAVVELWGK